MPCGSNTVLELCYFKLQGRVAQYFSTWHCPIYKERENETDITEYELNGLQYPLIHNYKITLPLKNYKTKN